jgi:hypothetical protein
MLLWGVWGGRAGLGAGEWPLGESGRGRISGPDELREDRRKEGCDVQRKAARGDRYTYSMHARFWDARRSIGLVGLSYAAAAADVERLLEQSGRFRFRDA